MVWGEIGILDCAVVGCFRSTLGLNKTGLVTGFIKRFLEHFDENFQNRQENDYVIFEGWKKGFKKFPSIYLQQE